jgi:predicted ribosomally synthesized peptide with SipW-like signal peptide
MGRKRIKQYLMLLLVIGVIAVVASGNGTFASFSAQVTNPGNTFVTGTLFLHENPNGGTECYSEWQTTPNGAVTTNNTNNSCVALFSAKNLAGGTQKAYVTLVNAGSIPATSINAQVTNCSVGANDTTEPRFDTSLACSDMEAAIQEVDSASTTANPLFCAYGTDNGSGTCTLDTAHNLGNANSTELGWTSPQTLLKDATHNADLAASGGTRNYVIEISPSTGSLTGNQLQNQKLSFDVSWTINQ